jgi:hypothetical protein
MDPGTNVIKNYYTLQLLSRKHQINQKNMFGTNTLAYFVLVTKKSLIRHRNVIVEMLQLQESFLAKIANVVS